MIPKQDLAVIESDDGTGGVAVYIQTLDASDAAILVGSRTMEAVGEFVPRPLLEFAVIDERDFRVR